jgi:hypothetical protein
VRGSGKLANKNYNNESFFVKQKRINVINSFLQNELKLITLLHRLKPTKLEKYLRVNSLGLGPRLIKVEYHCAR